MKRVKSSEIIVHDGDSEWTKKEGENHEDRSHKEGRSDLVPVGDLFVQRGLYDYDVPSLSRNGRQLQDRDHE